MRAPFVVLAALVIVDGGCAASRVPPTTSLDREPPRLVNAFFGLDDALPERARGLCLEAAGQDGMPVTFSRRLVGDPAPSSFVVVTASGAEKTPTCATLRPAGADAERHTVLLIGDLGSVDDPPAHVTVTGSVPLEPDSDALGLTVEVTPLVEGPTLVLAFATTADAMASTCPDDDGRRTRQIVVVVWAGGVVPADGLDDDDHRAAYEVRTTGGEAHVPFALGDLGDNDNYVHLCMDSALSGALEVWVRAGVVVDPRGDANPETSIIVAR